MLPASVDLLYFGICGHQCSHSGLKLLKWWPGLTTFQHGGFARLLETLHFQELDPIYWPCWPRYWVRRKTGFWKLFCQELAMHCGIAQCKQTAVKLAYPIIAHLLGATICVFLNQFGCNFQELLIYMPGVTTPIFVRIFPLEVGQHPQMWVNCCHFWDQSIICLDSSQNSADWGNLCRPS